MRSGVNGNFCTMSHLILSYEEKSSHLIQQAQADTEGNPYHCDESSSNFALKSNLPAHHSIHTGEKPIRCRRHRWITVLSGLEDVFTVLFMSLPQHMVHICATRLNSKGLVQCAPSIGQEQSCLKYY